jgi:hypothetical protein
MGRDEIFKPRKKLYIKYNWIIAPNFEYVRRPG